MGAGLSGSLLPGPACVALVLHYLLGRRNPLLPSPRKDPIQYIHWKVRSISSNSPFSLKLDHGSESVGSCPRTLFGENSVIAHESKTVRNIIQHPATYQGIEHHRLASRPILNGAVKIAATEGSRLQMLSNTSSAPSVTVQFTFADNFQVEIAYCLLHASMGTRYKKQQGHRGLESGSGPPSLAPADTRASIEYRARREVASRSEGNGRTNGRSISARQKLIEEERGSIWLCVEPLMHGEDVMVERFPAESRTFGKCKDGLRPLVASESVSPHSQELVHLFL